MTLPSSLRLSPMTVSAHLRYPIIRRILGSAPDGATVTEFGAGRGAMASRFVAAGYDYLGFEPDPESFDAAEHARGGNGTGVLHNGFPPEDPTRLSDVVVAFEVLEHIELDDAALSSWFQWLKPGGLLILSVPAHQDRFGDADVAVGHYRRYERSQLTELLGGAGFVSVEVKSVGFPAGFVLEAIRNRLLTPSSDSIEDRTAASGRRLQPPEQMGWLTAVAALPFTLAQRPFEHTDLGTGYVAMARRPSEP